MPCTTADKERALRQAADLMDDIMRGVVELGGPRYALMALLAVAGTLIAIGNFDVEEAHAMLDEAAARMNQPPTQCN